MRDKDRRAHPRHELETQAQLSVEQPGAEGGEEAGVEQREHDRVSVSYKINIEAGLELSGHEVLRLVIVGKTIDVSRGGMLISVDKDVILGARCRVEFLDSKGQIEPDQTWGRVRRVVPRKEGFNLAVQFDKPLAVLEP